MFNKKLIIKYLQYFIVFSLLAFSFLCFYYLNNLKKNYEVSRSYGVYIEKGPFWIYEKYKKALLKEKIPIKEFYSYDWDKQESLDKICYETMKRKDIDFVIGMGGLACKTLLKYNNLKTPVFCVGVLDPAEFGFISKKNDKLTPIASNFFIRYVPNRAERALKLFYAATQFKKIGIFYSPFENIIYNEISNIQYVAEKLNFELVTCPCLKDDENMQDCIVASNKLIDQNIDAVLFPTLNCFDHTKNSDAQIKALINLFTSKKIYTFAKDSSYNLVPLGSLLGFEKMDYEKIGVEWANRIKNKLLNSEIKGDILIDNSFGLLLNLNTAKQLEFNPSPTLLFLAKEIYFDF